MSKLATTKYAYVSGFCSRDSTHHRCQTTYGRLQTLCTCQCHKATVADYGQAELFEVASA